MGSEGRLCVGCISPSSPVCRWEGEGSRAQGTYKSRGDTAPVPSSPRPGLAPETPIPNPRQAGTEPRRPRAGWGLSCVWNRSLALRWHQTGMGGVGREHSRLPRLGWGPWGATALSMQVFPGRIISLSSPSSWGCVQLGAEVEEQVAVSRGQLVPDTFLLFPFLSLCAFRGTRVHRAPAQPSGVAWGLQKPAQGSPPP